MIAVIGKEASNKMIQSVLGEHRKGHEINYFSYVNTSEIRNIVEDVDDIDGILFSGIIGLKIYEEICGDKAIPYGMIGIDLNRYLANLLDIVLSNPHIDVTRIYMDILDLLNQYVPEYYDMLPATLRNNVKYFKFNHISDLTSENIYKDIERRYNNNQIDFVILSAASISDRLENIGVEYRTSVFPMEENIINSYGALVDLFEQTRLRNEKIITGVIEYHDENTKKLLDSKLKEYSQEQNRLFYKLATEELLINDHMGKYVLSASMMNDRTLNYSIGIGTGRTEAESKSNALSALKYANTYGKNKTFLLSDEKDIFGPINEDFSLRVNEYEMAEVYDQCRELGIKTINYCRIMSLLRRKNGITTEDVVKYLNIAHRSSNRILNILTDHRLIEATVIESGKKVGRPTIKYRLPL